MKTKTAYKVTSLTLYGRHLYVSPEVTDEELKQIDETLLTMAAVTKDLSTYAKMRNVLRK